GYVKIKTGRHYSSIVYASRIFILYTYVSGYRLRNTFGALMWRNIRSLLWPGIAMRITGMVCTWLRRRSLAVIFPEYLFTTWFICIVIFLYIFHSFLVTCKKFVAVT